MIPSVGGIIDRGGIILGSSRCQEFFDAEVRGQVVRLLDVLGIDRLVVVGGEGSLKGAAELVAESRLRVIGVPASIDNDYPLSMSCLGVDTAINTVVTAVRHFNDTAGSHHRIMVLEIMGRDCGHLAETAALASGAEIVVTPERPPMDQLKMEGIAKLLEKGMLLGRSHAIVLVAEGVKVDPPSPAGPTKTLADFLQARFNGEGRLSHPVEVRYSVLGHLQRGGTPTAADRLLAAGFAESAWEHLAAVEPRCGVLGLVQGRIQLQDFHALPGQEHSAQLGRIYQLQKDVSKYSVVSSDGSSSESAAPALRGRRRTKRTKPLTTERRT
jgi:6-phosphofructokinase 1